MVNQETGSPSRVEPILAVNDVVETAQYWHHTLGFPDKWTWGEPPNHGGVSWAGAFIQFSQDPVLAAASQGNYIYLRVKKLQALYNFHQEKNADVVEPIEIKPWGLASYTVRDINGYYVIFSGAPHYEEKESLPDLHQSVRIIARSPSVQEYRYLTSSVGWSMYSNDDVVQKILAAPVFAVVAEDMRSNEVIGCALLLGDHASFYYIKDVVVHPAWQGKKVGSAMMKELDHWLKNNGADKAMVSLITGESLAPFYHQFGFSPAFGMINYIHRDK